KPPKSYSYKFTAEGYELESGTIVIEPGKHLKKELVLRALATKPAMVALEIKGGTPEAKVELDGKTVGTLDQQGNLRIPDSLSEGKYTVVFSKPDFELQPVPLNVKPPTDAIILNIKLTALRASLAFETDVKNVKVKYRKEGESDYKEAPVAGKV